ncbi:hypothetical protein E0Z10_g4718 [Xylaria hypoxylon]|uniref:Ig-like domain-containing protein n=1 Tax=Xylaria hypoxylon TaxID=37992 RepID=A0A4Z0YX80_9PEZI|nr:hypothetical protein E0Z10_g4718 [Xylaria hypoxylon]
MFKVSRSRKGFFIYMLSVASHLIPSINAIATDVIADNGTPPVLTTGCLNNSFTAPTWSVESFNYKENIGISTVNFTLTSNMVDDELDCFGQARGHAQKVDGDCTSEDGEHQYSARFMFDPYTRNLFVDQAWVCNDNAAGAPVKFIGSGTKQLPSPCQLSECTLANAIRISAKLLEPIELSPVIPPAPPGHERAGCVSRSKSPSWAVSSLEWRTGGRNYTWNAFGIISGTGIAGMGMVRLNVTNLANQQTFSCVWQGKGHETSNVTIIDPPASVSPWPSDPGPAWYRCDTHSLNEDGNRTHNYEIETSGIAMTKDLRLQRPQVEPDAADNYVPAGTPIINGSVCFGPDFNINRNIESSYTMEPYALELPNPEAPKCTVNSFDPDKQHFLLNTAYVFRAHWWYFEREGEPKGGFHITILSSVTERELGCSGFSSKLNPNGTDYDPNYWFDCSFSPSDPSFLRSMRANYNANTSSLSVVMSWSCGELRPGNPIFFTAIGRGEISKPECADDSDGTTRCLFPAANNIPLPFTNITWDTPKV